MLAGKANHRLVLLHYFNAKLLTLAAILNNLAEKGSPKLRSISTVCVQLGVQKMFVVWSNGMSAVYRFLMD